MTRSRARARAVVEQLIKGAEDVCRASGVLCLSLQQTKNLMTASYLEGVVDGMEAGHELMFGKKKK